MSEFVDAPKPPAEYGLDAPLLKVTLKAKTDSGIELGKKDAATTPAAPATPRS